MLDAVQPQEFENGLFSASIGTTINIGFNNPNRFDNNTLFTKKNASSYKNWIYLTVLTASSFEDNITANI